MSTLRKKGSGGLSLLYLFSFLGEFYLTGSPKYGTEFWFILESSIEKDGWQCGLQAASQLDSPVLQFTAYLDLISVNRTCALTGVRRSRRLGRRSKASFGRSMRKGSLLGPLGRGAAAAPLSLHRRSGLCLWASQKPLCQQVRFFDGKYCGDSAFDLVKPLTINRRISGEYSA
jgi:hypothetical protein